MRTSLEVLAAVGFRKLLTVTKNPVRFCLRVPGERFVNRARVNQERGLGELFVFLKILGDFEKRWVRDNSDFGDIFECEVEAIPRTKAVTSSTEVLYTLLLECTNHLVDDGPGLVIPVFR